MSLSEGFSNELQYEATATRKCLERIPEAVYGWKSHEKSMAMAHLAAHIAEMFGWVKDTIETREIDLATTDYKPFEPQTTVELVKLFDKNLGEAVESLKNVSDESMREIWKMRNGEQVNLEMPRIAILRGFILKHLVHHRGQLSIYLRLNDIAVPSIYGPSADEGAM